MKPIVFFDKQCTLCRQTINFLSRQDHKKRLLFAPLDGKTASQTLTSDLRHLNTVILLEPTGKISIRSRAIFRIFWLLGGKWSLLGWLYPFPFLDPLYRFVAKHRKRKGHLPPLRVKLLP